MIMTKLLIVTFALHFVSVLCTTTAAEDKNVTVGPTAAQNVGPTASPDKVYAKAKEEIMEGCMKLVKDANAIKRDVQVCFNEFCEMDYASCCHIGFARKIECKGKSDTRKQVMPNWKGKHPIVPPCECVMNEGLKSIIVLMTLFVISLIVGGILVWYFGCHRKNKKGLSFSVE